MTELSVQPDGPAVHPAAQPGPRRSGRAARGRQPTRYTPTEAGEELRPIIAALGQWGTRWIPDLGDTDLDPHLLMWDVRRNVDLDAVPAARTVLRFSFAGVPRPARAG